ncbi:anhydro-N-acetylmuramic acid kinase [Aureibacter tunicatorum]|nr:anhydro-N-acetylmuramic acid kinase [Aureibacter tunicatorum]
MSGTSLDGLDIACCEFWKNIDGLWQYKILNTATAEYNQYWIDKLSKARFLSGLDLSLLDIELGNYFGSLISNFIQSHNLDPELIASHGHTVFHQPEKGLTLQIASGNCIMAQTQTTVINDFRSMDVAFGGQGAPLVPVGDYYLYHNYDACLNLGGIANLSYSLEEKSAVAYDICFCNIILNKLANLADKKYDAEGKMAASGKLIDKLFRSLESLEYYKLNPPKSLGIEWIEKNIFPIIEEYACANQNMINNLLRTVTEHIAERVNYEFEVLKAKHHQKDTLNVLVSGGGAHNKFLFQTMNLLGNPLGIEYHLADSDTTNFKEAIVFAFLGLLRSLGEDNIWASVTGAKYNTCSGMVHNH